MVLPERAAERADAAETVGDRVGQQLGVAERLAGALAGDGVEEQASASDERPARAVRLAEVAGQVGTAAETLGPPASADPVTEADRVQGAQEVAFHGPPQRWRRSPAGQSTRWRTC